MIRGIVIGVIAYVVMMIGLIGMINDVQAHGAPDNHAAINRMIKRHNVAINDLAQLARIACGVRQFEDGSFVKEDDDRVRYACLEFVSQINK